MEIYINEKNRVTLVTWLYTITKILLIIMKEKNIKGIAMKTITTRLIDFLFPVQNNMKDTILKLRSIADEKEQKEFKMNNLCGVTMSALLGESRTTNNVIQYNNIMCIDVDEEDNKVLFSKYPIE